MSRFMQPMKAEVHRLDPWIHGLVLVGPQSESGVVVHLFARHWTCHSLPVVGPSDQNYQGLGISNVLLAHRAQLC
jgi:hypothetical protein